MSLLPSAYSSSKDVTFNMLRILSKQRKGLKICHVNAQSLNNKIDEFRFTFEKSGIDVICVSETWLRESTHDALIGLNGYTTYRADRSRHGGGVAIFVRSSIKSKLCVKSGVEDQVEYLFVEVSSSNGRMLIGCVYRPNRHINFSRLFNLLDTLTVSFSDILISGDFNSDIITESSLTDYMSSIGLTPTNISTPTHFTQYSHSLLDIFFVNDTSKVLLYDQISAPCFSKHDLIFMAYDFLGMSIDQKISYRDFNNLNYSLLESSFSEVDWSLIFNMTSVDDQLLFLQNNIVSLYSATVPLKTRIISAQSRPWFTEVVKSAIRERDLAYSRWKRFKTPLLYDTFRSARRDVNMKIRVAKLEYFTRRFSSALGSKQKWKVIRDIGVGKESVLVNCEINVNELNRNFLNVPRVDIDTEFYNFEKTTSPNCNADDHFEFYCVTESDVLTAFSHVKSNAVGVDNMDPRFVRILLPHILPYITHLFNSILTSSVFPKFWKQSKIIPIPKSRTEYRPIAILCFLSKIFEKLLHRQISENVQICSLMTDRQSGFRPNHSCVTALAEVSENIRQNLDEGNVSFLVLLDHSKAFDSVEYNILCSKLKNFFNFSSTAILLLHSYLNGRSQAVFLNNATSEVLPVFRGVPQGSILGPLLFSLYINDLPLQLSDCNIHMYADDVQLILGFPINALVEYVAKLNNDLSKIHCWATANGLCLNPRKSKCLLIQKRRSVRTCDLNILLNNEPIQIVSHSKNLGIVFNDKLTWSNHINAVVGQTYAKLRSLWQTQYFTPQYIKVLLVKSYIMPGLLYGCELFANCDSVSKQKLNVIFNNVIRYVYGLKRYDHVSQYSHSLYGVSFGNLLNIRALILLHKIIYTGKPFYLFRKIKFNRSNRGRNIVPLTRRSLVSDWQFFIHAVRLWNSLPHHIQLLSNANTFKKNIFDIFK